MEKTGIERKQYNSNDIGVIIPVYNASNDRFIELKRMLSFFSNSIIVDDTGEKNKELDEYVRNNIFGCQYIYNNEEKGLSQTVNIGVSKIIKNGAKWALLLNEDSKINMNIIDIYLDFINTYDVSNVAIVCPRYNYDRHRRKSGIGYRYVRYTDMTGSMINLSIWKLIGGYDERFFIDGLDIEWCIRVKKNGFKIVRCNQAIIEHNPGITKDIRILNKIVFKYGWHSPRRYYYQYLSIFLNHNLYHDFLTDCFGIYKILKSTVLFENRREYIAMLKMAYRDHKSNYYLRRI